MHFSGLLSANEPRKDIASQLLSQPQNPIVSLHGANITKGRFAFSHGILKFSVAEGYSQLNKQEEKQSGDLDKFSNFGLSYHSLKLFSIGCIDDRNILVETDRNKQKQAHTNMTHV